MTPETTRTHKPVPAKVLSAAANLLAAEGAEALHLKRIAEGAGIGTASIYHYFRNKEELLVSLAAGGWRELAEILAVQSQAPGGGSPLAAVGQAYFAYADAHPALFALMTSEQMLVRYTSLQEAERHARTVLMAAVQGDARFPPEVREALALTFWALGRGLAAMTAAEPDRASGRGLAEKVWSGICWLVRREPAA